MNLSKRTLIYLSGAIWLLVGLNLFPLGIRFLMEAGAQPQEYLLTNFLFNLGMKGESSSLMLLIMGLAIGYMKSRKIFSKTVQSTVQRIQAGEEKQSLSALLTPKYLILIAVMMLLGMSMNWLKVPADFRGLIDVAVGSALINGAVMYFQSARATHQMI